MRNIPDDSSLLLPERARLLHIGPMKTGTTSSQAAASALRGRLLSSGVRYPGTTLNHRKAIGAFMGKAVALEQRSNPIGHRPDRAIDEAIPPRAEWDWLMDEIESDKSRRIWISHEFVAESSHAMAQNFADALGPSAHIVITLRNPAEILPSLWTQRLKSGHVDTFDAWLQRVFKQVPDQPMRRQFRRSQNQGALVNRWASIVGPENVTVVVVDKSRPALLLHTFEKMLGLRAEMLTTAPTRGSRVNRSLSLPEAELCLRINEAAQNEVVSWRDYAALIRNGAVTRMLDNRIPVADEPRVAMPEWAAELARTRGRKYARRIAKSGVRVVGDLNALSREVPTSDDNDTEVGSVPIDVAVESLLGAVAAGIAKGTFERTHASGRKQRAIDIASRMLRAADTHTARDIAGAMKAQIRRKAQMGISKSQR